MFLLLYPAPFWLSHHPRALLASGVSEVEHSYGDGSTQMTVTWEFKYGSSKIRNFECHGNIRLAMDIV